MTGGTVGLGYYCALEIARKHPEYQVILASRSDRDPSAEAINKLLRQNSVSFRRLDLGSLANVRAFANEWANSSLPPIQSMVFNAALQFPGEVEYTEDGYEKTFAVCHMGHALLFSLLRPHFVETIRIVNVASGVHDPAVRSGLPPPLYNTAEELAHPPAASAKRAGRARYSDAKLANVLYTYALDKRFATLNKSGSKHWTTTAFDPGLMPGTGLARDAGAVARFLWLNVLPRILPILRLVIPNTHTPQDSGASSARLAIGKDLEGVSGVYFERRKKIKSSEESYHEKKQEDLWDWTVKTLAGDAQERDRFALRDLV